MELLAPRQASYREVQHESDDGNASDIELAETTISRTVSHQSDGDRSFRSGKSLLARSRQQPELDLRGGDQTAFQLVNTNWQRKDNGRLKRPREGWQYGVRLAAWTASLILLINVVFAIVMGALRRPQKFGAVAYEGSCSYVGRTAYGLHIVINVFASLLLCAGNYTMQVLAAYTRQEVDRAHAKGTSMDIGVPSLRNLSKISWTRAIGCLVLALSSMPIHLLYNSVIFRTVETNAYWTVVAKSEWLKGGNFSIGSIAPLDSDPSFAHFDSYESDLQDLQAMFMNFPALESSHQMRNLSNVECIDAYFTEFVTGYNSVMVVTNESGSSANETVFAVANPHAVVADGGYSNYEWVCSAELECDVQPLASTWTVANKTIEYCLAQVQPEHCTIQVSLPLLVVVIVCNVFKVLVISWTALAQKQSTLVTIGDAIASYLDSPDPLTKGRCLSAKLSKKDLKELKFSTLRGSTDDTPPAKSFHPTSSRWFAATSRLQRTLTFGYQSFFILIVSGTLAFVISVSQRRRFGHFLSAGFGTLQVPSIIDGPANVTQAVVLANVGQVLASILYLFYNRFLTCMLLAKEWSQYAIKPRPLRVTSPRGGQRSTHFLQLPWRYSVPLLAVFIVLHWLISVSLFMSVIVQFLDGVEYDYPYHNGHLGPVLAVSNLAIILVIALLIAMLVTLIVLGCRRFKSPMPVAGSCSVAIAAACHPPKDDIDAARLPVQWGEVHDTMASEIGHCTFTSRPVQPPVPGRMYAGWTSGSTESRLREDVRQRSSS